MPTIVRRRTPEADLLAERLLAFEEPARGGFVDEQHGRRGRVIRLGQETSPHERNAHGAEVARRHAADRDLGLRGRLRLAADDAKRVREAGIERVVARHRRGLDAGEPLGLLQHPVREGVDLLEVREAAEVDRIPARRAADTPP